MFFSSQIMALRTFSRTLGACLSRSCREAQVFSKDLRIATSAVPRFFSPSSCQFAVEIRDDSSSLSPLTPVTSSSNASTPLPQPLIREPSKEALVASLRDDDYFDVYRLVDLKELFEAGVHYGHKRGMGYDPMVEYLLGHRFETCIFDLNHTVVLLRDALNFIAHIAFRGGIVLFITNHRETTHLVEKTAIECGEYAHTKEWYIGTLTNSTSFFGDVIRHPDLCIFLSTKTTVFEEHTAVKHAAKMLIPSVGICDSDADPRLITFPIPGNDDSVTAIRLYLRLFKAALLRGKTKRHSVMLQERDNEAVAEEGGDVDSSSELSVRQRNERLLRQIAALQRATIKNSETESLETTARGREEELDKEEEQEIRRHLEKVSKKKREAKKISKQRR